MEKSNFGAVWISMDEVDMNSPGQKEQMRLLYKVKPPITSEDGKVARYPICTDFDEFSQHRYSEFLYLREKLIQAHPWYFIPHLPEKTGLKEGIMSYIYEDENTFYEYRRFGLEQFLQFIQKSPILAQSKVFTEFINLNEADFASMMQAEASMSRKGWFESIVNLGYSVKSQITAYFYNGTQQILVPQDRDVFQAYEKLQSSQVQMDALYTNLSNWANNVRTEANNHAELRQNFQNLFTIDNVQTSYAELEQGHKEMSEIQAKYSADLTGVAEKEVATIRRIINGAMEAIDRRNQLISNIQASKQQYNTSESRQQLEAIQKMEYEAQEATGLILEEAGKLHVDLQKIQRMLSSVYIQLQRDVAD